EARANRLYEALLRRDAAYDGLVYVGVTTTKVFCRLSCPARKPRAVHCEFFEDPLEAERAGFRPCKRCGPLDAIAPSHRLAVQLRQILDEGPAKRWRERSLAEVMDASTARRAFRR